MDFKKLEDKEPKPKTYLREVGICERCEGILIARKSMERGMGPTCWHKAHDVSPYLKLEQAGQLRMGFGEAS